MNSGLGHTTQASRQSPAPYEAKFVDGAAPRLGISTRLRTARDAVDARGPRPDTAAARRPDRHSRGPVDGSGSSATALFEAPTDPVTAPAIATIPMLGGSASGAAMPRLGTGGARLPLNEVRGGRLAPPVLPFASFPPVDIPAGTSSAPARYGLLTKVARLCRTGLAEGERGPAVCGCGSPALDVPRVGVHLRPGVNGPRGGFSGVKRCKSPWLCPVCAPAAAKFRAERVQSATDVAFARGGAVALVVLTASHGLETPLAEIKSLVATASTESREGRAWERLAESSGLAGVVVGQEVTISRAHGWHYHQHLAAIVDGEPCADALASIADLDAGTVADVHPLGFVGPLRPAEVVEQARAQRLAEAIRLAVGRGKRKFGPPTRAAVLARLPGALDPVLAEREEARRMLKIGSAALPSPHRIGPPTATETNAVSVMRACRAAVGDGMGPPSRNAVAAALVRTFARARARAVGHEIAERYKAAVRAAGGTVSDVHGTFVRVADSAEDASGYTSKGSMAWEVSGGHKDRTKADSSLTPWDLVRAAYDGDAWARHRWAEYVAVMPRTRSCVITKSLAARLGIEPAADDPPGDEAFEERDGRVGSLPSPVHRTLKREGLLPTFVARLETSAAEIMTDDSAEAVEVAGRAVLPALVAWATEAAHEADARHAARLEARRQRAEEARAAAADRERIMRRDIAIQQALHRLGDLARGSADTLDRLSRACADVAAVCPGEPPPTPADLLRFARLAA